MPQISASRENFQPLSDCSFIPRSTRSIRGISNELRYLSSFPMNNPGFCRCSTRLHGRSRSSPLPTRIVHIILHIDLVSARWLYSALLTDLRRFACPLLCVCADQWKHLCACGYRPLVGFRGPAFRSCYWAPITPNKPINKFHSMHLVSTYVSNIQASATKQVNAARKSGWKTQHS